MTHEASTGPSMSELYAELRDAIVYGGGTAAWSAASITSFIEGEHIGQAVGTVSAIGACLLGALTYNRFIRTETE